MASGDPKIRSSHKLTFFQFAACIAKVILRNLAVIGDMSAVVVSIGGAERGDTTWMPRRRPDQGVPPVEPAFRLGRVGSRRTLPSRE